MVDFRITFARESNPNIELVLVLGITVLHQVTDYDGPDPRIGNPTSPQDSINLTGNLLARKDKRVMTLSKMKSRFVLKAKISHTSTPCEI